MGPRYILVRSRGWRVFGVVGLAAAFGLPVIVASGGTPNPSAALAYFFIVTSSTLALSTQFAVARLAWVALAGGFLFVLWGGVYTLLPSDPYLVLAYYGALTIGTLVVADRHNWRGVGTTATVAAVLVVSVLSRLTAIVLLGYLAIVDAAALVATIRRDWRSSDLVVLLASTPALLIVASDAPGAQALKLGGASLIFALFNLMPSLVRSAHTERRLVTVLLADAALALQMAVILGEDNWNALAIFAVALAAYHVLAAQLLLRRDLPRLPVLVNLGLALTALTAAIPLKLRGEAITLTWSVEAIALAWAASRIRNTWTGRAAFAVSALAIVRLIGVETPSIASAGLIASAPGLAFTVGIAALAVCAHYLHRLPWTSREERYAGRALGVAAAALLLWWIGWEIDGAYDRAGAATAVVAGARQATLSAWLTLYGFALVVVGIWRDISAVRWGGIALLAITVFKVFLIDLAALAVVFRVMSLAVLGVLLILASLAYGRYRTRLSRPSSPRGT